METTQISINWWLDKKMYRHTIEYYSTIKRNEVPVYATSEISLENIMVSEGSQSQKTKYYFIYMRWDVLNRWIYKESKLLHRVGAEESERMLHDSNQSSTCGNTTLAGRIQLHRLVSHRPFPPQAGSPRVQREESPGTERDFLPSSGSPSACLGLGLSQSAGRRGLTLADLPFTAQGSVWGTSLVVQRSRIHLAMQQMQVQSLVGDLRSHTPWSN